MDGTLVESHVVVATLILSIVGLFWHWSTKKPSKDFPPGPRPLPLVGNLLDFAFKPPHMVFLELRNKYGDIFSVKIGQRWTVILNSLHATREALVKQPVNFAGRPDLYSFKLLSGDGKSIALSDYSIDWANNRKMIHASLRNLVTGDHTKFEALILEFTPQVASALDLTKGKPFNPKQLICHLVYSILGKICFGESFAFDDPMLLEKMAAGQEFLESVGNGLPIDFFPSLAWIPFKRAEKLRKLCELNFLDIHRAIDCHRKTFVPGKPRDFIDQMLDAQLAAKQNGEDTNISDEVIATGIADIHGGGTDTTIVTLYWSLALMVQFPHVQDKIAQLADEVIGRERLPTLADREKLPYIVAAVHEVLRYSTKLPMSVPHSTTQDCKLDGYFIPKGTMVMTNLWAIHRDEEHWEQPYSFRPEHFLDETGTVRKHPEGFVPFSTGRRVCIGESMVKAELFLLFTWLFQHFKFSKVSGTEDQSYIEHGQILVANEVNSYKLIAKRRF